MINIARKTLGFSGVRKEETPDVLRVFHVKVGEWEREIGIGYLAECALWEQSNRAYFIAKLHERDDWRAKLRLRS